MTERDVERNEDQQELVDKLGKFIHEVEVGTSEYRALRDYSVLNTETYYLGSARKTVEEQLADNNLGKGYLAHQMSRMRVHETKVAIFEAKIEERRTDDPSYDAAFGFIYYAMIDIPQQDSEELDDAILDKVFLSSSGYEV